MTYEWIEGPQGTYTAEAEGYTLIATVRDLGEWADVDWLGEFVWPGSHPYTGEARRPEQYPYAVEINWPQYRVDSSRASNAWWIPDADRLTDMLNNARRQNAKGQVEAVVRQMIEDDAKLACQLAVVQVTVRAVMAGIQLGEASCATDYSTDEPLDMGAGGGHIRWLADELADEAIGEARTAVGALMHLIKQ